MNGTRTNHLLEHVEFKILASTFGQQNKQFSYFIEKKNIVKVEIKFLLNQKFSNMLEKWSAMSLMTRHTLM